MAYRDFKDLAKKTAADKVLKYEAFNIDKNPKYDGIKESCFLWFINFLIKRLKAVVSLRLQINLLLNPHLIMKN